MLEQARRHGWEGIMAKRADASYRPGVRTRDWLKLKIERRQEFVVGGWTEPRNSREHFGALLLGYYNDAGALVYAGHTGTGFTRASLLEMSRKLSRIERSSSPFVPTPRTNERAHWVAAGDRRRGQVQRMDDRRETSAAGVHRCSRRQITARGGSRTRVVDEIHLGEIRTNRWTRAQASGAQRRRVGQAIAPREEDGLRSRDDLVIRSGANRAAARGDRARRRVRHARSRHGAARRDRTSSKVFFPSTKQTKGDLMRFYARMSPLLLPAMADRPLVMKRFPNGITRKSILPTEGAEQSAAGCPRRASVR